MQFVGILNEHESGIVKIGRSLFDITPLIEPKIKDLDNIINYLRGGRVVVAFLHYVYDKQNNPIAPLIFYTDGKWIWPSYLAYYLKLKYSSLLPFEFVADMQACDFSPAKVNDATLEQAQRFYADVYGK